jgi:hypothetical protein
MVAQILRRNVHVVKSMLSSATAPPSSVMNLAFSFTSRSECPVMVAISASVHHGNGEPRDAGCAHGRFRNLR